MRYFLVETTATCDKTFEKKESDAIFTINTPKYPSDYGNGKCEWTIDIPQETYQEIESFPYQFGHWETDCKWRLNDECKCGKQKICKDELIIENEGNKRTPINGSGMWREKLKITDQGFHMELDRHDSCEETECGGQMINTVNCDDACKNKDTTIGKRKGFKMTSSKLMSKTNF